MNGHRRILTPLVLLLGIGVALTGCSSSSSRPEVPPVGPSVPSEASGQSPPATPADASVADVVTGYLLGPGDAIRLTVFRHEDLSGEFELDGEGYFAMPLVGEILGGGRNSRQLESEIEVKLKGGGYLVDPQVSIDVLNYRPFYVIGEVNNPGSYEYVNGMNLINAIALAGGFTYRADQGDIVISRGGSGGTPVQGEPDTPVLPGDIVEVTERFF